MTDPNSMLSRLRFALVRKIEPKPDPGKAWCFKCSLSFGRTLTFPADGIEDHAVRHSYIGDDSTLMIQARWPVA